MCLLTGSWVCAATLLVVQGQSQAAIDVLRSGLSLQQNTAKGYDTARSAYLADGDTALHQHPAGHKLSCYRYSKASRRRPARVLVLMQVVVQVVSQCYLGCCNKTCCCLFSLQAAAGNESSVLRRTRLGE
jgi:hypothetical protein